MPTKDPKKPFWTTRVPQETNAAVAAVDILRRRVASGYVILAFVEETIVPLFRVG